MKVLLSLDATWFEHTAPVAICMPNAALTSLAGNVDAHHDVAVADLVLAQAAWRDRGSPGLERPT